MKLSRAVGQFVEETRMSKAKATANGYGSDLQYLVTLARPDSVLMFNEDLVTSYFRELSRQGLSMSSLHRKSTAMSQFARWGVRKGLWTKNPMDDPKFHIKRPDSLPKPFDGLEVERLMQLELSDVQGVLRGLLYYTGLRVTPICDLKWGDLSFAPLTVGTSSLPGSIRTLSKGGKKQLVPMAPELAVILQSWVAKNPFAKSYDPVLVNRIGQAMTRRSAERYVGQWGERAKVGQCIPHRFRHTYATDLRRQGVELDVIQRLLGHSSIATTQIYAKVADEEIVAAVLGRSHVRQTCVTPTPLENALANGAEGKVDSL